MKRHLSVLVFSALALAANPSFADELKIKMEPISTFKRGSEETRFGALEFLDGAVLTSKHDEFGGISALRFVKDNNFVAVTDKARVITGTLERSGNTLKAIKREKITRIKNSNGETITGAEDKDAESIEIAGAQFLVGYERNDRILRFNMRGRKLVADAAYKVDLEPYDFPNNKGPEAIALQPESGELFVFAEYALNSKGNHRGFVVKGGKVLKEIEVKAHNGYSLTDAAFLPGGDLLMLERYFNPFTGVFMRMRRIESSALSADEPIDGEIIIDVDDDFEIDNMEGLAVTPYDESHSRLTLVSDDNFSRNQRTVLLEFKIAN